MKICRITMNEMYNFGCYIMKNFVILYTWALQVTCIAMVVKSKILQRAKHYLGWKQENA
jgi:hypothetical protein